MIILMKQREKGGTMTPKEIINELRKIATYSTSKKEVCTQAADLIEEYEQEFDRIHENLKEIKSILLKG